MSEQIRDYIYSPEFDQPGARQSIMVDPPTIPRADVSWFFRIDEPATQTKSELLTPEQERTLFLQYNYARWRACHAEHKKDHDYWAATAHDRRSMLVEYNLALVVSMVHRKVRGREHLLEDIRCECYQRLIRAVELFDVNLGFKFSTYACRGIINQATRLAQRMGNKDMVPLPETYSPTTNPLGERREADAEDARSELIQRVRDTVEEAGLSEVERRIINARFLTENPQTLEAVGRVIGVSKERVRQIQVIALDKIKNVW